MDGWSQKGSPIFRQSTSFERKFHAESNAVPQMFQFGLANELEAFLCDVRGDVRSSDESHMSLITNVTQKCLYSSLFVLEKCMEAEGFATQTARGPGACAHFV